MMEAVKNFRGERDKISNLPDCLLHLIMSFLTAHEAVRTCVLSKRWKDVWTTLPFLDFDMCKFKNDIVLDNCESENYGEKFRRFTHFVNMTLLLREASNLHKFRFSCSYIPRHLRNMFKRLWIPYVIKHSPRVIEINTAIEDPLPLEVFSCTSLVNLSLCFTFAIPCYVQYQSNTVVVNLPFLRRLHLKHIFLNQDFMDNIFCGCPVLEFLHLQRCYFKFSRIRSQSLKHLILDCHCSSKGKNKLEVIDAPILLFFNYRRCLGYIGLKMLTNMPSLTSASISCYDCFCGQYNRKGNILTGISSVQTLKLYGACIRYIFNNELLLCPEFQHVKDLSVDDLCLNCHFNLLASFLDHFPNLKKLSLSDCGWCYDCKVGVFKNQESLKMAPFRCKHLETADVRLRRDKNLHCIVKYLQDTTKGLQAQINITYR